MENGKIIQNLPEIEYNGMIPPLFIIISQTHCIVCGSELKLNIKNKFCKLYKSAESKSYLT